MEAQVQHICKIVDVPVFYNAKHSMSSGGSSDSVVIQWQTSLCGALYCSYEICGFSGLCRSPRSASDKIHAESSSNASSRPALAQILVQSSESPQISFGIGDEQGKGQELWSVKTDEP